MSFYNNFICKVGSSKTSFVVMTGVRQGCYMSASLLHQTVDLVLRQTRVNESRGIRWTLFLCLKDSDISDNLALLSHTHQRMPEMTSRPNTYTHQAEYQPVKTNVMMLNVTNPLPAITKQSTND